MMPQKVYIHQNIHVVYLVEPARTKTAGVKYQSGVWRGITHQFWTGQVVVHFSHRKTLYTCTVITFCCHHRSY